MEWAPLVVVLLIAAHPDSVSRSRVTVDGARVTLELRFQTLSLIEVVPEIDLDGDRRLSREELAQGEALLEGYVLERYRIELPGSGDPLPTEPGAARRLAGKLESAVLLAESELGPLDLQWMQASFAFEAPPSTGSVESLVLTSRLFQEKNPWHRDIAGVVWNGEPEVRHLFVAGSDEWLFQPEDVRRPGVLALFARLGVQHILEGYDHLAFLVVLLVASRRFRGLVGVVTAFTVAHSITLGLAALDPGGLLGRIPSRFVELAIALSIAYVACENLLVKEARNPWLEAGGFGLLHGLGFAGFLGDALEGENLIVTALFGFNVGVEAGQLAVVVVVCALLWTWKRLRPDEGDEDSPALAPRWLRVGASSVVAVLGFAWFVERAGWLG